MDGNILEFKRQMIHLLNGSVIAAAIYLLKPAWGGWILLPLVVALLLLHALPKLTPDLRILGYIMYHFERRKDIDNFPFKGAILFGYGIMFPIILLDAPYAAAVVLILSVGDSFSNLVGRRFGKTHVVLKTMEGWLAFFITSWAAASLLIPPGHAALLAFCGAAIELFSFADDNVLIPATLSLLAKYLLL